MKEFTETIYTSQDLIATNGEFDTVTANKFIGINDGENILSVKDFGALGDGVTDDTEAIQACFDAVDALATGDGIVKVTEVGANIIFPPGTYRVDDMLKLPFPGYITLVGDGAKILSYVSEGVVGTFTGDIDMGVGVPGPNDNTIMVAGTGYPATDTNSAEDVATTNITAGATGSGCKVKITTNGGAVTGVTITTGGTGYEINDILTIDVGDGNATFKITAIKGQISNCSDTSKLAVGAIVSLIPNYPDISLGDNVKISSISGTTVTLSSAFDKPFTGSGSVTGALFSVSGYGKPTLAYQGSGDTASVVIDGLAFDGTNVGTNGDCIWANPKGTGFVIKNCVFKGFRHHFVHHDPYNPTKTPQGANLHLLESEFRSATDSAVIWTRIDAGTIRNCLFKSNEGIGIEIGQVGDRYNPVDFSNFNVSNNYFGGYNFHTGAPVAGKIESGQSSCMIIDGCLIEDNWRGGIRTYNGRSILVNADFEVNGSIRAKLDSGALTGTFEPGDRLAQPVGTVTDPGSGYSSSTDVAVSGGSGTGMKVDVTDTGGAVTAVKIRTMGTGYKVGDVITITGGGGNATFTLSLEYGGTVVAWSSGARNLIIARKGDYSSTDGENILVNSGDIIGDKGSGTIHSLYPYYWQCDLTGNNREGGGFNCTIGRGTRFTGMVPHIITSGSTLLQCDIKETYKPAAPGVINTLRGTITDARQVSWGQDTGTTGNRYGQGDVYAIDYPGTGIGACGGIMVDDPVSFTLSNRTVNPLVHFGPTFMLDYQMVAVLAGANTDNVTNLPSSTCETVIYNVTDNTLVPDFGEDYNNLLEVDWKASRKDNLETFKVLFWTDKNSDSGYNLSDRYRFTLTNNNSNKINSLVQAVLCHTQTAPA